MSCRACGDLCGEDSQRRESLPRSISAAGRFPGCSQALFEDGDKGHDRIARTASANRVYPLNVLAGVHPESQSPLFVFRGEGRDARRAHAVDHLLVSSEPMGDEELGMIEGSLPGKHSSIGKRAQKGDQVGELFVREVEGLDVVSQFRTDEIPAAVVERHHLLQGRHPAVVHVGAGELDVAQGRHLEGAIDRDPQPP